MNINLTLIGQMISFLIFIGFCWKFVWPPIIGAMQTRQKTIADGLAAAEQGAKSQELAKQEAANLLKEAKQQAAEIVAHAEKRGSVAVEQAKETARAESEKIKVAAQSEIDQELNRAKEALRQQVAGIAVAGAEQILKREIDSNAHQAVLDELISQVG